MRVFDDKVVGILQNNKYYILSEVNEKSEVIFKASYIVISDLCVNEKVTALFDLIVLGNLEVNELDIKGKLICLGSCRVRDTIVVQNDIWTNELVANTVICHGQMSAQSIDSSNVSVDGNIMVGKTLSIDSVARVGNVLLCGETAFGAGHVVADRVLTVEPLDLDDGVEAIEDPKEYHHEVKEKEKTSDIKEIYTEIENKYIDQEDYRAYIIDLSRHIETEEEKSTLVNWLGVIEQAQEHSSGDFAHCYDGMMLIRLLEIQDSKYFTRWNLMSAWTKKIIDHFGAILKGTERKFQTVPCNTMQVGDLVFHKKYGRGKVEKINRDSKSTYAEISFDNLDSTQVKKFIIPESYQFFAKIVEIEEDNSTKIERISCRIDSYTEWLEALSVINKYKHELGEVIYSALFDRIMAYVGLKAKYMRDRFKEKGWN